MRQDSTGERQAREALDRKDDIGTRVRECATWYARYAVLFGAASVVAVLCLAVPPPVGPTISTMLWILGISGLSVFAARQEVTPRNFRRRHLTMLGTWLAVYTGVLVVGLGYFPENIAWWFTGGLLTGLPAFATARKVRRDAL
ncbi:hypothetical protein GCM10007147_41670 [Nocardiopsis kunsanensis]|uniref:Uncharacterized protein n=1 Tax=Nocardiopsis kunsanensis TaxID=141693 RepID=A0A919CKX4_9ACTN|nr:hypothetical protein [Nocardiopsis kunsanensis]GHD35308.1 hypothetical protein GCM10007147_41670 [Nocardiopsis kunsanensis]